MRKVMIIEDNKKIRDELSVFLGQNGYACEAPEKFENLAGYIIEKAPHLLLLDINLPGNDGYYICKHIRRQSDMPIIVVTSRDTEMDELMAMNLGADDFITKPYNTQILLARIDAVLKRAYREAAADRLDCGDFCINLSQSMLEYGGKSTELTKNELKIMACLYEKRGAIVSRDELMRYLWDSDMFIDDNTLTVNIARLRRKLEDDGLSDIIGTRRGQGYMLR